MCQIIRLPMIDIGKATRYDHSLLEQVDSVSEEEKLEFSKEQWNDYTKGWYTDPVLPEIAQARYYSSSIHEPVIPLAGRNYRVRIEYVGWDEPWEADGKFLILEETTDHETIPDRSEPEPHTRGGYYWKFFGQPVWVQNSSYPAGPDGKPCCHLVTVETGWGDSGNWNVLVALNEEGLPTIAYFEASCC